ncbi:YjcZ family sporulation protein, partial [Bacillus sp. NPDC060175]
LFILLIIVGASCFC